VIIWLQDILIELNKLEEFVLNEGFSQDQVEVAVVSSSGDIEAAFKHLRSLSSNISSPISERKMANVSNGVFQENSEDFRVQCAGGIGAVILSESRLADTTEDFCRHS
jgi:hypothetical protein